MLVQLSYAILLRLLTTETKEKSDKMEPDV